MYIKTQKFFVLGVSKSGYFAASYILQNGGTCYVYEELESPRIESSLKELIELGAIKVSLEQASEYVQMSDVIVLSPGVPINHELAVKAKRLGKRIIGEFEFGYLQFAPPIVAVTGTNGKTTTVTLIDQILKENKNKSQLVGNVGIPITSKLIDVDKDTVCVAEVSSFQLESMNAFCPHVSCILNIAPDHLERHYTMENYIFLKKRIYKNQRESEFTVLNFDDKTVRSFFAEIKAKVVWVSVKEKVDGAYRIDGKLYYNGEYIMDENELTLIGEHNVYNALFAIACAKIVGVNTESIVKTLKNFKGVKHRIERICDKNGIKYYNDSKATNTASTISALETMKEPTVLILGGSEKGESYEKLFEAIKQSPVKHVILMGASRYRMLDSAGKVGYSSVTLTADFSFAVKIAALVAQNGDNVLLSPACASFDNFHGFEERGEAFTKIVEGL